MSTRRLTILYWTTTGLIAALMLASAYMFCFTEAGRAGFEHLRLPAYFRFELTVAKALGALALVIPGVPSRIKELAYFGFGITIISAIVAHSANGDGWTHVVDPLIVFAILYASYVSFEKRIGRA